MHFGGDLYHHHHKKWNHSFPTQSPPSVFVFVSYKPFAQNVADSDPCVIQKIIFIILLGLVSPRKYDTRLEYMVDYFQFVMPRTIQIENEKYTHTHRIRSDNLFILVVLQEDKKFKTVSQGE